MGLHVTDRGHGADVVLARVSKRYRVGQETITALDDVSLTIPAGSVLGVAGPSGSGKSTLLHVIGAMDAPDSGRILVGDTEVTRLSRQGQAEYRRRIGFVFQRFHLLPALSVLDNIAAPLLPYPTRFDKHKRARDLVAAVGLAGRERSLPSHLSGGQQQRVAIARALVGDPILLMADEPTGNLDSQTGDEIMELLLHLRDQRGMTVIVATHDPLIATRCERIVRLHDGHVLDDVHVASAEDADALLERISRIGP